MTKKEISPAGNVIYRYDTPADGSNNPLISGGEHIEHLSRHIVSHIGEVDLVFHEIVSSLIHIDIHWVKPSAKYPFHTLVTSGMSDLPMSVPNGREEDKYAELCILLPAEWKLDNDNVVIEEESHYWPMRWLKTIARFPHEYNTWLGIGHTIPNGENAEPFASNTKLGCMLLMPSISLPDEFFRLQISGDKTIKFYCLYPIYKEEMDFKLKRGLEALIDRFEKSRTNDIVVIDRPNTCSRKKFFGLW